MSRNNGEVYYFNVYNGKSQWHRPYKSAFPSEHSASRQQQVRCSHILVKHAGSRRPSSWRQEKITRSREDALELIKGYRDEIKRGERTFKDLATQFSDCSSAKRAGDLGVFGRGAMQRAFEAAAFALQPNQLSQPVISDSGVHLILRTG
jgi:NIMA-interacting peptidyl-prolyl cis-trans isomerase 1